MINNESKISSSKAAKAGIAAAAGANIIAKAELQARELKVSQTCLVIFFVLNFVAFGLLEAPQFKESAMFCDAFFALCILLYKTPFGAIRTVMAIFAGFYAYIFYSQNMPEAATVNFLYWISGALLTIRMKIKYSGAVLIISEAIFVTLIYLIVKA